MICIAQRSTLVLLPSSKHEALRRVLHGLPISPAIQISSVMLRTAATKAVKGHDKLSEQQEVHRLHQAFVSHWCATGHCDLVIFFPVNH